MTETIIAVFPNRTDAESVLARLESAGFNPKDMSLIVKDTRETVTTTNTPAEGAVSGATTGGLIGGLAGLLVGIGAITTPGLGAVLIGGPIAAALGLTRAAASTVTGALTGAVAGGLIGTLTGFGVPEDVARDYENVIRLGGVLLAVPATDQTRDQVRQVLQENNAEQIRTIYHDFTEVNKDQDRSRTDFGYSYPSEVRRGSDIDKDIEED